MRQVEGFGRAGCQFEFSVMWLHSVVYELFVEPVMTKECVPLDATFFFWHLWEARHGNIRIQELVCICRAFLHLYTRSFFFDMWSETFNRRFLAEMGKRLSALCKLSADTCKKKTLGVPEAQSGLAVLRYRLLEMLSVYTVCSRSVL